MTLLKKTFAIFLVSMLFSTQAHQQTIDCRLSDKDPSGKILPALFQQVSARIGTQFQVSFLALDSVLGIKASEDMQGSITDPYGTLAGLVFFAAGLKEYDPEDMDSSAIGFFKDGHILWCSRPMFKGAPTQLFYTGDLNGDGKVDLVTLWMPAYTYHADLSVIYVLSWDGKTCRIISDTIGRSSRMTTTGSTLRLVEYKEGIYDIDAYWSDSEDMKYYFPDDKISTRPWVTYRWDGSKYGLIKKATR